MSEWGGSVEEDGCTVAGQRFYSTPAAVAWVFRELLCAQVARGSPEALTGAVKRAVAACGGDYGARLFAEEAHEAEVPSAFAEQVPAIRAVVAAVRLEACADAPSLAAYCALANDDASTCEQRAAARDAVLRAVQGDATVARLKLLAAHEDTHADARREVGALLGPAVHGRPPKKGLTFCVSKALQSAVVSLVALRPRTAAEFAVHISAYGADGGLPAQRPEDAAWAVSASTAALLRVTDAALAALRRRCAAAGAALPLPPPPPLGNNEAEEAWLDAVLGVGSRCKRKRSRGGDTEARVEAEDLGSESDKNNWRLEAMNWGRLLAQHGGDAGVKAAVSAAVEHLASDATAAALHLPRSMALFEARLTYAYAHSHEDSRLAEAAQLLKMIAAGDIAVLSSSRLLSDQHDADSLAFCDDIRRQALRREL